MMLHIRHYCQRSSFFFLLFVITTTSSAQTKETIVDDVNTALEALDHLHFRTTYLSKYYTETDTLQYNCEVWLAKVKTDTILGMDIRSVGEYPYGKYETFHRGTDTWIMNYETDTITYYDQQKDHWDGYNGNIKTSWTTETPLTAGITASEEDSLVVEKQANGDWVITRYSPDLAEYAIFDISSQWWVDAKTLLPYRRVKKWYSDGAETYKELNIELLSTNAKTVTEGLNQPLPDLPVINYVKPNKDAYGPLFVGASAPDMEGFYLHDSTAFNLKDYQEAPLIMVDFWYQTCGPCVRSIPYIDSLEHEFGDAGLVVIGANSRDHDVPAAKLLHFVEERGGQTQHLVMIDTKTERKKWKCNANPTFYLVQEGKIVWVQQGFAPELMPEFRQTISSFLAEE